MNMRLAGCIFIPTSLMIVVIFAGYFYVQRANYYNALDAIKECARLNDFPTTATNLTVETEGNMFTREFTVEFDAPRADIENWLNESPGTKNVAPTVNGSIRKYSIEPGGGAQHAELELDENAGHVKINAFWS